MPTLVFPANGATGVSTSATLTVNVDDPLDSNLTVSFYGRPKGTPGADFTLIAIPDPQYYAASYPSIYNAQMNWVVSQKDPRNIPYVISLGDNVNPHHPSEWTAAPLPGILTTGGVPYGLMPATTTARPPQRRTSPPPSEPKQRNLLMAAVTAPAITITLHPLGQRDAFHRAFHRIRRP